MNSFYIAEKGVAGGRAELFRDEAKHAGQVMRMRAGEEMYAVDPEGNRFLARIAEIEKDRCGVELIEALPDNEAPVSVTLYQGIPKAEKLELIAQKLTELGAVRIVPVKMDRCVVKLNEKDGAKRTERLDRIAREAAKQCKRGRAAKIEAPMTWKQAIGDMERQDIVLVPWEDAQGRGMCAAHAGSPDAKHIGIVIGPEGGMSAEEVEALRTLGAKVVTLGPRILRTETAALTSVAMAMTLWGDIG